MVLRLVRRAVWHWQGLLLWLVRHPELRKLPAPWPSVETVAEYRAQPGGREISAQTLALLIQFRNRQGFQDAFLENELVKQALAIARSRTGILGRVRSRARAEAALDPRPTSPVEVSKLLGPRGGLPKTKDDLIRLATAYGLDPVGKTVDQLKHLIRVQVETGARPYEEQPAGSSKAGATGPTPPAASGPAAAASGSASQEAAAAQESTSTLTDQSEMLEAVQQELRRFHGDAQPDLLMAVTLEALHQIAKRSSLEASRQEMLSDGSEAEMAEMGWTKTNP